MRTTSFIQCACRFENFSRPDITRFFSGARTMACLVEFPAIDYLNAITERYFQDLSRFKDSVSALQLKYGKVLDERDQLEVKVTMLTRREEELRRQLQGKAQSTHNAVTNEGMPTRMRLEHDNRCHGDNLNSRSKERKGDISNIHERLISGTLEGRQEIPSNHPFGKSSVDIFFLENPSYLDKFIRCHITKEQLEHWLEEKTRVAVVLDKECSVNPTERKNDNFKPTAKTEEYQKCYQSDQPAASEWVHTAVGGLVVHQNETTVVVADSLPSTSKARHSWPRPTPVQKKTLALGGNVKIPLGRDLNTICRLCGKQFSSPSVRNRHMLSHSGQRPHKCDICGKGFILASHLKGHLGTHFKREVFKCRRCQIEFKTAHALDEHMIEHKAERRYKCDMCGKRFLQLNHLQKHIVIHSEVQFCKCDFCGNQYTEANSLKRHLRIHTGEKPYSCKTCGRHFSFAANLRLHEEHHLDGHNVQGTFIEPEEEPEPIEEDEIEAEECAGTV